MRVSDGNDVTRGGREQPAAGTELPSHQGLCSGDRVLLQSPDSQSTTEIITPKSTENILRLLAF